MGRAIIIVGHLFCTVLEGDAGMHAAEERTNLCRSPLSFSFSYMIRLEAFSSLRGGMAQVIGSPLVGLCAANTASACRRVSRSDEF